jgi:type IV pilus assembly protein PilB
MNIPLELHLPITSRIKVLSNMDVTERRRPQDGQFSLFFKNINYDFRVSSLPTYYGEKLVLRILDETAVIKGLGDLGLTKDQQKLLQSIIEKPYGMILVTGPTGSGKTTTLYSAMNLLNDLKRNIVTIEDPIEYKLEGINQVQVDNNIDLTFANGLRAILRQDPDVIMVGEIRDTETAKIAIRAALTGHTVFSTLHTNTSVSAISTLAHMEIQRFMIASAILCIIAQRLVRKICTKCIKSFKPDKGLKKDFGIDPRSTKLMYRGSGCDSCFNTGYSGRIGLYEILPFDDEIRELIVDGVSDMELSNHAISKKKMVPLSEIGLNAIYEKITTPEEVMEQVFLI